MVHILLGPLYKGIRILSRKHSLIPTSNTTIKGKTLNPTCYFVLIVSCILLLLDVTGFSFFVAKSIKTLMFFSATTMALLHIKFLKHKPSITLPPGPKPWPLIGNLPEFFKNKPRSQWILMLMDAFNTDIACIRVGSVHIIPVKCPKIAQEFLNKQDLNFASRPITMATTYISHGLFPLATAPFNEYGKKMKKLAATEMVSPSRLRWLQDKRMEEADNLVRYVYNQCYNGGATVDVRHVSRAYTGNVIRKMMFNKRYFGEGREDGGPTNNEEEHVQALFTGLSLGFSFRLSDYIPCLKWLDLDGHEKRMISATKVINKYHNVIIDERMQQWKDGLHFKKKPEDLLDVLISLEDCNGNRLLSIEEIKSVTSELVHASVDSPSNATEWALAEMINHPKILQKAVDEIDQVVGKERLVNESDISNLNYIKACAKESFRLHPVAPFNLPHLSMADTVVAGYFIPKGSHVLLSRTGLGRNPKVWNEPLTFKPERHINFGDPSVGVELTEPDLRFITFSTGRRRCLSAPLGTTMTVMLLARLIQGFHWTTPTGISNIDLSEASHGLFLEKPLLAYATLRLPTHIYPMN